MNVEAWDRSLLWRYRARLIRLRDADTIVCLVDSGYRGRHEAPLRLVGVNAPEKGTAAGDAATRWLDGFLAARGAWAPGRWRVRVETIQRETVVEETTSFERWISRVWVADDDGSMTDVAAALVAAGHATRVAP